MNTQINLIEKVKELPKKVLIGINDGENIYLSAPSWDCGWYWGFGYLGNRNCHYHVDGLNKKINLHDALIEHFGKSLTIRESKLWEFSELFQTFYTLRETAEVLGRGGSHLTSNPCKDIIINKDEVERINNIVLPSIFIAIYDIIDMCKDDAKLFKKLVSLTVKGDTSKVVKFMFDHSITTDDLNNIEGITKDDYYIIHSEYWKQIHAKK